MNKRKLLLMVSVSGVISVAASFFLNPFRNILKLELIATAHLGLVAIILAICSIGYSFSQSFSEKNQKEKVRKHISGMLSSFFYLTTALVIVWVLYGGFYLVKVNYPHLLNEQLENIIRTFSILPIFGLSLGFIIFMYQFWVTIENDEAFFYDESESNKY